MKLNLHDLLSRDGMPALIEALGGAKGETRFVGGCVRDTLLHLAVNDVDLATNLEPEEVIRRLKQAGIRAVPTGIAHGTVTAVLPSGPVEVTTLRRDVSTDGRRATIAYTDDWREDAARRDFTINALSADPVTGEIFDYFGGLDDLEERRVRFIGDPLTRIAEDHLRIFRFFRFHTRFASSEIDLAALDACAARANDLMALSRERVADELLKLLALPDPAPAFGLMVEHGILRPVLPEIEPATVERLAGLVAREDKAGIVPDAIRRLAALLPADPDMAAAIAARLRLSKKALKRLVSAAETDLTGAPDALAYRIGVEEAIDRLLLAGDGRAASLLNWERPGLGISGGTLIQMGLPPGPLVAKTLQAVERDWAEEGFPSDKEAQRALARRHVDQALRDSQ